MVSQKIGNRRLLKLANHLKNGVLGHKKFDFTVFNVDVIKGIRVFSINYCGTNGCAIGECPIVFKKDWFFEHRYGEPVLRNKEHENIDAPYVDAIKSAMAYFNITMIEVEHLFCPNSQMEEWGKMLGGKATRKQVAANIIRFVELRSKPQ